MGKIIKIISIILAVVVLLFAVAAGVFISTFDPNEYKSEITAQVKKATGRDLVIGGDIGLTVFPWLGVEIQQVSLTNAPGFGKEPFASVAQANVRVETMPLIKSLGKDIRVDTVVLDGLQLNLAKNSKGVTNWDDLQKASSGKDKKDQVVEESAQVGAAALAIGGVQIKDAVIVWDDRQAGQQYRLEKMKATTGPLSFEQAIPVSISMMINSAEPAIEASIAFDGGIKIDQENQSASLEDGDVTITAKTDTAAKTIDLKSKITGVFSSTKQALVLKQLALETLGLKIKGDVTLNDLAQNLAYNGKLSVEEFVPREIFKTMQVEVPQTADNSVLTKAVADFGLSGGLNSASLNNLNFVLDDTTLSGNASIANFSNPAIRVNANVNTFNLDRYLPPSAQEGAKASPATATAAGASILPVDAIRNLNLEAKLHIDKLVAFGLNSSNVNVTVNSKNGVLRVHPATADLYQGTYNGDVQFDVRGKTPVLSMNEKLTGIESSLFLKDMGGTDRLTGKANFRVNMKTSGATPDDMQKNLGGDLAFSFDEGALKGINIAHVLRTAYAVFEKQPIPASPQNQTNFTGMSGTATVNNGVLTNTDLVASLSCININGGGTVDLNRKYVDYLLDAKIVNIEPGLECEGMDKLKDKVVQLPLEGPLESFTGKPNVAKILTGLVKKEVENKAKEKLEKKLEDKLGDDAEVLKKLFKGF